MRRTNHPLAAAGPLRAAIAGALAVATGCLTTLALTAGPAAAAPACAAAAQALPSASVVPVPGDKFAAAGTSITFRGVSPAALAGLTVVGARSGRHAGKISPLSGGGAVFTPTRRFDAGEQVTVEAPGLRIDGSSSGRYTFATARPASPAEAASALRMAAATDASTTASPVEAGAADGRTPRSTAAIYAPPACPLVGYRSAPSLHAQQVCMNLGVTTSGTQPGTYLFLTPGGEIDGAGVYSDTGNLVWWLRDKVVSDLNESVVQFDGNSYIALWSGAAGSYGDGVVTLYNNHYQVAGQITAVGGFPAAEIDLHEFQITPSGDALFGIYDPVTVGSGVNAQTVLQYVVQEVSLVQGPNGIQSGQLQFEWDSLTDVPTTQSATPNPGASTPWDYFHGNAITQDTDGNLVVSSRNTWGLYKIDDTPGDTDFGHVVWAVGDAGDNQLEVPWCYQHDVVALGHDEYSLFDDGGAGPGCLPGSSGHPARALIITINPATSPAGLTLDDTYSHNPPITTGFTGSTQVLSNGDVLVYWANIPQITEYSAGGAVKMDLTMSAASYRGIRAAWVGEPLTPPSVAVVSATDRTSVWASWNGSTQVAEWQVVAGPTGGPYTDIGPVQPATGFETAISLAGNYPAVAVEALASNGSLLAISRAYNTSGYVIAASTGSVTGLGDAAASSSGTPATLGSPAVAVAETPDGHGHWLAAADGAVLANGDARFHGSLGGSHLNAPIVGIAPTPDGGGYWLVAADGGVFSFGDAKFYGSEVTSHLNAGVVGVATTPDGHGYWLVASDGGVFTFGDAKFRGSEVSAQLNASVVGMATTTNGLGYWLVSSDGGIFTFGTARYHGSAAAENLASPVVGMALDSDAGGYWLLTASGTVFAYGSAVQYGPLPSQSLRAVAIAAAPAAPVVLPTP